MTAVWMAQVVGRVGQSFLIRFVRIHPDASTLPTHSSHMLCVFADFLQTWNYSPDFPLLSRLTGHDDTGMYVEKERFSSDIVQECRLLSRCGEDAFVTEDLQAVYQVTLTDAVLAEWMSVDDLVEVLESGKWVSVVEYTREEMRTGDDIVVDENVVVCAYPGERLDIFVDTTKLTTAEFDRAVALFEREEDVLGLFGWLLMASKDQIQDVDRDTFRVWVAAWMAKQESRERVPAWLPPELITTRLGLARDLLSDCGIMTPLPCPVEHIEIASFERKYGVAGVEIKMFNGHGRRLYGIIPSTTILCIVTMPDGTIHTSGSSADDLCCDSEEEASGNMSEDEQGGEFLVSQDDDDDDFVVSDVVLNDHRLDVIEGMFFEQLTKVMFDALQQKVVVTDLTPPFDLTIVLNQRDCVSKAIGAEPIHPFGFGGAPPTNPFAAPALTNTFGFPGQGISPVTFGASHSAFFG